MVYARPSGSVVTDADLGVLVKVWLRLPSVTVAGMRLTLRTISRVVSPFPLVVLVKTTVSLYPSTARASALLLIVPVTMALSPGARVPLVVLRSTQVADFTAVQSMEVVPGLLKVNWSGEGEKGPPKLPEDVRFPAGLTTSVPTDMPVPVRAMSKGFSSASLLVIWMAAVLVPMAPGEKVTSNVVLAPGASVVLPKAPRV